MENNSTSGLSEDNIDEFNNVLGEKDDDNILNSDKPVNDKIQETNETAYIAGNNSDNFPGNNLTDENTNINLNSDKSVYDTTQKINEIESSDSNNNISNENLSNTNSDNTLKQNKPFVQETPGTIPNKVTESDFGTNDADKKEKNEAKIFKQKMDVFRRDGASKAKEYRKRTAFVSKSVKRKKKSEEARRRKKRKFGFNKIR